MKASLLSALFLITLSCHSQIGFNWAKQIGGASDDAAESIAEDSQGNILATGVFWATADMDPGPGVQNATSHGCNDVFITKMNSSGGFLWAVSFGGSSFDVPFSIATDNANNIFITGIFNDTVDFDPGPGVYNLISHNADRAFICKLDPFGNFLWAKDWGNTANAYSYDLKLDNSGNVLTTGYFMGTVDFDPGPGVYNLTANSANVFISKIDASGNFMWAKQFGGPSEDQGCSIALDAAGNIYTTGFFYDSADFDPGPGVYPLNSFAHGDVFISKLDPDGNFIWAKSFGGADNYYGDEGLSIAVDPSGNVYTTGIFGDTVDFDPGPGVYNMYSAGFRDVFISKLNSSGDFVWAKRLGGNDYYGDSGNSLTVDQRGHIFTIGTFSGTADFDPGASSFLLSASSRSEVFISELDNTGNFVSAVSLAKVDPGNGDNQGNKIIINNNEEIYIAGAFTNTINLDPISSSCHFTSLGSTDAFVCKLNSLSLQGISENSITENLFSVYPNPSPGIFNINFSGTHKTAISIYDVFGNCIMKRDFINSTDANINLSGQSKGIYFMEIADEKGKEVKKIILE